MASPKIMPVPEMRARVALLISPFEQDHEVLDSLFREHGWTLYRTRSLRSGLSVLRRQKASIVVTEENLAAGSWRDVLEAARQLPTPPLVIVSSLHADDHLWAEALNLGAYDVMCRPIEHGEAVRLFRGAWIGYSSSHLLA